MSNLHKITPPPPPPRESLSEGVPQHPPVGPRTFGLTASAGLAAVGLIRIGISTLRGEPLAVGVIPATLWSLAVLLLVLALAKPSWLSMPNLLWFKFGLLISRVVNPIILFILYATCVVPIGLVMRLFGHDPLRSKRNSDAETYWVASKPSPIENPMRHQF